MRNENNNYKIMVINIIKTRSTVALVRLMRGNLMEEKYGMCETENYR